MSMAATWHVAKQKTSVTKCELPKEREQATSICTPHAWPRAWHWPPPCVPGGQALVIALQAELGTCLAFVP